MPTTEFNLSGVSSLIRQRDSASLGELIARYEPLLQEMARVVEDPKLRSKVDREDLVQQTCLDIVRGFGEVRASNRYQFAAWVRTLFVNNVRTARRRYIGTKKRDVYSETSISDSLPASTLRKAESIVAEVIWNERVERLINSLKKLPAPVQTLLKWRYEDGLTHKEIALHVSRSEDAVRMLINRCLTRLRPEIFDDDSRF